MAEFTDKHLQQTREWLQENPMALHSSHAVLIIDDLLAARAEIARLQKENAELRTWLADKIPLPPGLNKGKVDD